MIFRFLILVSVIFEFSAYSHYDTLNSEEDPPDSFLDIGGGLRSRHPRLPPTTVSSYRGAGGNVGELFKPTIVDDSSTTGRQPRLEVMGRCLLYLTQSSIS
jgi:hypothetical protein